MFLYAFLQLQDHLSFNNIINFETFIYFQNQYNQIYKMIYFFNEIFGHFETDHYVDIHRYGQVF